VYAWKGVTRYAGFAVMGVAAIAGFMHYLVSGPNRVSNEDEEQAERLVGEERRR
jgi:formate dehydrogenase iron-sulfur subunit